MSKLTPELSKIADDKLTALKQDKNHITTQLSHSETISYNSGFFAGFASALDHLANQKPKCTPHGHNLCVANIGLCVDCGGTNIMEAITVGYTSPVQSLLLEENKRLKEALGKILSMYYDGMESVAEQKNYHKIITEIANEALNNKINE